MALTEPAAGGLEPQDGPSLGHPPEVVGPQATTPVSSLAAGQRFPWPHLWVGHWLSQLLSPHPELPEPPEPLGPELQFRLCQLAVLSHLHPLPGHQERCRPLITGDQPTQAATKSRRVCSRDRSGLRNLGPRSKGRASCPITPALQFIMWEPGLTKCLL